MKSSYDRKADAFYVRLWDAAPPLRSLETRPGIFLDFTDDGKLAGLEVLDASEHIPAEVLAKVGEPSTPMTLEELEKETGLSAQTWRVQLHRGRLQGKKVGATWTIEYADALNYLESRSPRGRPAVKRKARRPKAKA